MTENNKTDLRPQSPISWYPGHMKKTKDEIKKVMPLIDIVYELVDARVPFSSKIKDIDYLVKNKTRVLIMTKKDLCDINITNKWVKHYEDKGYNVLLLNMNNNIDYKKIIDMTNKVAKDILLKREQKGIRNKEIRALVIGIPNVGKSTLINKMAGKKVAVVGNKPGVTKNNSWLKTKHDILLLDTPGILWPKFDTEEIGLNLASIAAIRQEILPVHDVALYILNFLSKHYPNILKGRYKIDDVTDINLVYEKLAKTTGSLLKGGEINYDKIDVTILNDLKNEKISGITLDRKI